MMTTARAFNIEQRHDAFLGSQDETKPTPRQEAPSAKEKEDLEFSIKLGILSKAVDQFLVGEMSKAELKAVRNTLK